MAPSGVWGILHRWGWLRPSGVAVLGRLRRWLLALPMLVVACSYAVAGIEGSTPVVASALVSLLWVSINEKIYSRGMVQRVLTPLGPIRSAIGVGYLFGIGHLQNYLFFDAPLDDTLWQMLSAALFGFACAGLRFAIGSVWPMVVVHGLDDFSRSVRRVRRRTGGCTSSMPRSGRGCCAATAPGTCSWHGASVRTPTSAPSRPGRATDDRAVARRAVADRAGAEVGRGRTPSGGSEGAAR
ncbi:CPBP family intramembrane glutamic endopeptidase [Streptomyces canus]|uniref:CPBP family intramembrane glutamic endopeptidase n=1 Tax=Streptomyces canus TaxID=58343 RepID=UPI003720FE7A